MTRAPDEKLRLVWLSDAELALLDGQCNERAQAEVTAAKARLAAREALPGVSPGVAGFIADAVGEAEKNGRLIFRHASIGACPVCRRDAGYAPLKRTSSKGRKGQPNYDRPLTMPGVELAERFVRVSRTVNVGCCMDCWAVAKPLLAAALERVRAEVSAGITGKPPAFRKHSNAHCTKCDWRGHEGQMGLMPTLLGNGCYPGKCPNCGAENLPLGRDVIDRDTNAFTIVAA